MKVTKTDIADLLIFQPKVYSDKRGFFMESYNRKAFAQAVGRDVDFIQDNHSASSQGVLRGLHYQVRQHAQGKLVRALVGSIFDVAVDLRESSATFGAWFGVELSASNKKQLWVPEGFAHGFLVLTDYAEIAYKTNQPYSPGDERSIRWDDPTLAIEWPEIVNKQLLSSVTSGPVLSEKDKAAPNFMDAEYFA